MKKKKTWLIVVAVLAWLVLMASLAFIYDARTVRFYMTGAQEQSVEQGSTWAEPGIYAVTNGRLFGESKKHIDVYYSGSVDTAKPGSYTISYSAQCLFGKFHTSRTIHVVDSQPPVIELKHIEGYQPSWIEGYVEEGYSAYDACDGDITDKVRTAQYADKIVYTVADAAGNEASVERPLPDYRDKPLISLNGGEYMEILAGDSWHDPGFNAMDGLGNDLSASVVVDGQLVQWLSGEYTISYSLESGSGEVVSATRTVRVLPHEMPERISPEGNVIYLTFDDGPCVYTGQLLDLLSAYGVPATFFVTGADSRYYNQIGRAYREGHSIGVHSTTHDYSSIYSSEEAWFEDFFTMQEIIYQQTGEYTKLFRFPGGSSNTVSSFNPGIMSRLSQIMTDMGYRYFDWNVASGDAGETTDTQQIVENIIQGCQNQRVSVVLQHDIKDYSIAAVEQVILWARDNGYSFRALGMQSPQCQHGINN